MSEKEHFDSKSDTGVDAKHTNETTMVYLNFCGKSIYLVKLAPARWQLTATKLNSSVSLIPITQGRLNEVL